MSSTPARPRSSACSATARRPYDVVVLDVMLPGKDGFAVVAELRAARQFVPVLILTARGRPEDVLKGFGAGADDYLPKPTELAILLARVGGLLRRAAAGRAQRQDRYTFAGKTIDFDKLELRVGDRSLPLTLMEANLLRYLVAHEGKAVSRKAMLEEVWGVREDTDTRAIDNFIVRLRRYIETEPARPAAPADRARRRLPLHRPARDDQAIGHRRTARITSLDRATYSCGATSGPAAAPPPRGAGGAVRPGPPHRLRAPAAGALRLQRPASARPPPADRRGSPARSALPQTSRGAAARAGRGAATGCRAAAAAGAKICCSRSTSRRGIGSRPSSTRRSSGSAEKRGRAADEAERMEQRAREDRVASACRASPSKPRAVAIERCDRAPERVGRGRELGVIAFSSPVARSWRNASAAWPERRILKYSSSSRAGALRAISCLCGSIASRIGSSIVNSSRAASTTARSMRTGSSRNRTSGSPMQRIRRECEILQAADVVDDRERRDVVEERVDGEVAAEGVFLGGAVGVVPVDQAIALPAAQRRNRAPRPDGSGSPGAMTSAGSDFGELPASGVVRDGVDLAAESRHLDRLRPELDVGEPEPAADDPAVPKELLDLMGMRRRADVEVLRPAVEQQVPNAAADEVGDVVVLVQPVKNLECVGIDLATGDAGALTAERWSAPPSAPDYSIILRSLTKLLKPIKLSASHFDEGFHGVVGRCRAFVGTDRAQCECCWWRCCPCPARRRPGDRRGSAGRGPPALQPRAVRRRRAVRARGLKVPATSRKRAAWSSAASISSDSAAAPTPRI